MSCDVIIDAIILYGEKRCTNNIELNIFFLTDVIIVFINILDQFLFSANVLVIVFIFVVFTTLVFYKLLFQF